MRRQLTLATACLVLSASSHANLLVNGGAEMGNLTGWTVGGVSNPFVDDGSFNPGIIGPRTGNYAFVGNNGPYGSLTQNVLLPGYADGARVRVSFWEQGLSQAIRSDHGYVSLTWRDANGAVLSTVDTPIVDSHEREWANFTGFFDIPLSAFSVDYTMNFVRAYGFDLDGYFDDNELAMVPEPGSLAVFALGGLLLAGVGRRRARPAPARS